VTVVAVDWSGRRTGEQRFLWLAEAAGGVLLRLEAGRTRAQLVDELLTGSAGGAAPVVGFDFSFSLPGWFLDEQGCAGAPELWAAATVDGERWLRECPAPFWGLTGRRRPDGVEQLRATEAAIAVGGIRPKSTFQIGGAGSVGTGSVRGFPALARLRSAGFAIWPFDAPASPPVALEIYPRTFTGPVVKSDPLARLAYLDERYPELACDVRDRAVASEDAFDAAVSAVVMSHHERDLRRLPVVDDPVARREGWVWTPDVARRFRPSASPAATG
jgi:hypothetical protein